MIIELGKYSKTEALLIGMDSTGHEHMYASGTWAGRSL